MLYRTMAAYGTTLYGRIISLSSWSKMWQCQTYPGPIVGSKGYRFVPGDGALGPVVGASSGAKRTLMMVTMPVGAWIVSFHPISFGAGACGFPVK